MCVHRAPKQQILKKFFASKRTLVFQYVEGQNTEKNTDIFTGYFTDISPISFVLQDWSTPIMCGGMALAAIMFFINKYAYALGAIGGTGFMYAAKSFVGDGTGCTVDMAKSLLGIG